MWLHLTLLRCEEETEETREVTSEDCAGVQFVDEKSFNNFILTSLTFHKSKVCTNDQMFL